MTLYGDIRKVACTHTHTYIYIYNFLLIRIISFQQNVSNGSRGWWTKARHHFICKHQHNLAAILQSHIFKFRFWYDNCSWFLFQFHCKMCLIDDDKWPLMHMLVWYQFSENTSSLSMPAKFICIYATLGINEPTAWNHQIERGQYSNSFYTTTWTGFA